MLEKKNVINVEVYITNEDVPWFAAHAILQAGIVPNSEVKEFTNLKCWMISESPYDFSHRLRWRVGC